MTEDLLNSSPPQPAQPQAVVVPVDGLDGSSVQATPQKPYSLPITLLVAAGFILISWVALPPIVDLLPLGKLCKLFGIDPSLHNGDNEVRQFIYTAIKLAILLPILAILIRVKGFSFLEYCNLKRLNFKSAAIWLLVFMVFHFLFRVILHALALYLHRKHSYDETSEPLLLLLLGSVVLAPLAEEILWRGFVFKGVSESRAGPIVAIIFTSLAWASLHQQYNVAGQLHVACDGLIFGFARHITQSTTVSIVLHGAFNLWVTLQLIMWAEYGWRF
jgi:membrane protease YdiL (CAAX protease family)